MTNIEFYDAQVATIRMSTDSESLSCGLDGVIRF